MTVRSGKIPLRVLALIGALALAIATRSPPCAAAVPATDPGNPAQLIESVARAILTPIDADRAQFPAGSIKLDNLVNAQLMPHFDVEYAARFVLGPHWREASPGQRTRFTAGFYQLLVHNCGMELAQLNLNQLQVLPYRGDPATTYTTVDTLVQRSAGNPVNMNYSMRRTTQGWKAFDVAIDGISYDESFRNDFGTEIAQKGLNEMISRLERDYGNGAPTINTSGSHAAKAVVP
jgi:phospholipid transport system substrate-binding protein